MIIPDSRWWFALCLKQKLQKGDLWTFNVKWFLSKVLLSLRVILSVKIYVIEHNQNGGSYLRSFLNLNLGALRHCSSSTLFHLLSFCCDVCMCIRAVSDRMESPIDSSWFSEVRKWLTERAVAYCVQGGALDRLARLSLKCSFRQSCAVDPFACPTPKI